MAKLIKLFVAYLKDQRGGIEIGALIAAAAAKISAAAATGLGVSGLTFAAGAKIIALKVAVTAALSGLSYLIGKAFSPSAGGSRVDSRGIINESISPRRYVLGQWRVGGKIMYYDDYNEDGGVIDDPNDVNFCVIALAISEGPCESIDEIYIDDRKIPIRRIDNGNASGQTFKLGDKIESIYDPDTSLTDDERSQFVDEGRRNTAEYPIADYPDGAPTFELWEYFEANGQQGSHLRAMSSGRPDPWRDTDKANFISWVAIRMSQPDYMKKSQPRYHRRSYFKGFPKIEFVMKGMKHTYPGQTIPIWTANSTVIKYWWWKTRRRVAALLIDTASVTAGISVSGADVMLENLPPAYSNYHPDAKRYSFHGIIFDDDDPVAIESAMDYTDQGVVIESSGKLIFRPGTNRTATLSIDEDNIVEAPVISPAPPLQQRYNQLTLQLEQSHEHIWQKAGPFIFDDTAQQLKDGKVLPANIGATLGVNDPVVALRLMAIQLRRARGRQRYTYTIKPGDNFEYVGLNPTDRVMVTDTEHGLNNQLCEILAIDIATSTWLVTLELFPVDLNIYDDTFVLPPPKDIHDFQLPDFGFVEVPTDLSSDEFVEFQADGTEIIKLQLQWKSRPYPRTNARLVEKPAVSSEVILTNNDDFWDVEIVNDELNITEKLKTGTMDRLRAIDFTFHGAGNQDDDFGTSALARRIAWSNGVALIYDPTSTKTILITFANLTNYIVFFEVDFVQNRLEQVGRVNMVQPTSGNTNTSDNQRRSWIAGNIFYSSCVFVDNHYYLVWAHDHNRGGRGNPQGVYYCYKFDNLFKLVDKYRFPDAFINDSADNSERAWLFYFENQFYIVQNTKVVYSVTFTNVDFSARLNQLSTAELTRYGVLPNAVFDGGALLLSAYWIQDKLIFHADNNKQWLVDMTDLSGTKEIGRTAGSATPGFGYIQNVRFSANIPQAIDADTVDWTNGQLLSSAGDFVDFFGVEAGKTYLLQAQHENKFGDASEWSLLHENLIDGDLEAPGRPLDFLLIAIKGGFIAAWRFPKDLDYRHTEVWVNPITRQSKADQDARGNLNPVEQNLNPETIKIEDSDFGFVGSSASKNGFTVLNLETGEYKVAIRHVDRTGNKGLFSQVLTIAVEGVPTPEEINPPGEVFPAFENSLLLNNFGEAETSVDSDGDWTGTMQDMGWPDDFDLLAQIDNTQFMTQITKLLAQDSGRNVGLHFNENSWAVYNLSKVASFNTMSKHFTLNDLKLVRAKGNAEFPDGSSLTIYFNDPSTLPTPDEDTIPEADRENVLPDFDYSHVLQSYANDQTFDIPNMQEWYFIGFDSPTTWPNRCSGRTEVVDRKTIEDLAGLDANRIVMLTKHKDGQADNNNFALYRINAKPIYDGQNGRSEVYFSSLTKVRSVGMPGFTDGDPATLFYNKPFVFKTLEVFNNQNGVALGDGFKTIDVAPSIPPNCSFIEIVFSSATSGRTVHSISGFPMDRVTIGIEGTVPGDAIGIIFLSQQPAEFKIWTNHARNRLYFKHDARDNDIIVYVIYAYMK